jgi:hypothetical protein
MMKEYIKLLVAPCSIFYINVNKSLILFALGQEDNAARKVLAQANQVIKQFISAIPKYNSHYSHLQNSHTKCFDHDMTYLNCCSDHWLQLITLYKFLEIFGIYFNNKHPQSDTCHKCDKFYIEIEDAKSSKLLKLTRELENVHYLHYRKVEWENCH